MLSTLFGIVSEERLLQYSNAYSEILVRPDGSVIDGSSSQE